MWSVRTGPYLVFTVRAFDDGQDVPLHALARHVRGRCRAAPGHLVDLVEEDDAVLLGAVDGLGIDAVHVDEVLLLLGDEYAPRLARPSTLRILVLLGRMSPSMSFMFMSCRGSPAFGASPPPRPRPSHVSISPRCSCARSTSDLRAMRCLLLGGQLRLLGLVAQQDVQGVGRFLVRADRIRSTSRSSACFVARAGVRGRCACSLTRCGWRPPPGRGRWIPRRGPHSRPR